MPEKKIYKFAAIILPLPLKPLTYAIPDPYQNDIHIGSGVIVPLHNSRLWGGIVVALYAQPPSYPTQAIVATIDPQPLYTPQQLTWLQWIAHYYMANLGNVLSMGLPRALLSPNNTTFQLHPDAIEKMALANLEDNEKHILTLLQTENLTYATIVQRIQSAGRAMVTLLMKGLIHAIPPAQSDQIIDKQDYLTLATPLDSTKNLYKHTPKQQLLLAHFLPTTTTTTIYATKKELVEKGYSKHIVNRWIKKRILVKTSNKPYSIYNGPLQPLPLLTEAQKNALVAIQKQFTKRQTVLLHGTMRSGKSILYMHLIQAHLCQQKQVLYIVPETNIQIVEALKVFWQPWLTIHHTQQSQKERLDNWHSVRQGERLLVMGSRSALCLPFKELALIIVDEEHHLAYKQGERMPYYHARESSLMLAKQYQAKVLLGSATPSIESYYNAQSGKYGLVTLDHRFNGSPRPQLFFIDLNAEQRAQSIYDNLSSTLLSELKQNIQAGGQAIIFHNRKGYARYLVCAHCGWTPRCLHCAINLTYHQTANHLRCHYCGHTTALFNECNNCGSSQLHNSGFGTEKVVETLQLIFPNVQIGRMDLDNIKQNQATLAALSNGSMAIVVATQIIAKGLDFKDIRLIGVLDIDGLLYFPDFRSYEKCFQLITQLAGRAQNPNHLVHLFIQTTQLHHPLFPYLALGDYRAMYQAELKERNRFLYPPYSRLIKISLSSAEMPLLHSGAAELKEQLVQLFDKMVIGPQPPLIEKIKNQFLLDLFIKIGPSKPSLLQQIKEQIKLIGKQVEKKYKRLRIKWDVDPV